jgi:hypothetical protein
MKLVTRKSECRQKQAQMLVKSPKEAIRRTLSNYEIVDGIIVRAYLPSYVSRDAIVLNNVINKGSYAIELNTLRKTTAIAQ